MGTSNSTAMLSYPVDPEDFIYQTPSAKKNEIYVQRKKIRQKLKVHVTSTATKSKVCRRLEYTKSTKSHRKCVPAGGVPHQWRPRCGQLKDIWCRPKKRRKSGTKMVFNKPISYLEYVKSFH